MRGYLCKENTTFFFFNFFAHSTQSLYFGFTVAYLIDAGYSSFFCGLVNALISITALIIQPVAGYITDSYVPIKRYSIFSAIMAIATTFLLPLTVEIPTLVCLSIVLMSLFSTPLLYLLDNWTITLREKKPYINYGVNRSGGSVGYAFTSLIVGNLIGILGSYWILFILHVVFWGFVILCMCFLPSVPCRNVKTKNKAADMTATSGELIASAEPPLDEQLSFVRVIKLLLHNSRYMMFLVSAMLYFFVFKANSIGLTYKILSIDGTDSQLGAALFIGALFESPILIMVGFLLQRFKLTSLYLSSLSLILMRALCMTFSASFFGVAISQMCQALSYALYMAVSLEMISKLVPVQIRTTSVTVLIGMTTGFGCVFASLIMGYLIDRFGVVFSCGVMSIIGIVSVLFYALCIFFQHKKDPKSVL